MLKSTVQIMYILYAHTKTHTHTHTYMYKYVACTFLHPFL